jgi:outer membrane protein OmpA-like peptidoglycan-associated protein
MIALQTYAHHIEQPAYRRTGIEVAPKSNWELGSPREVTVFAALPIPMGTGFRWKPVLTLYFPWDSAVLTEKQKQEILALPKASHFQVLGYASRPGSDTLNYRLGLERAQAVARVLEAAGVATPVRVLSWGNAFSSSNPAQYPRDQKAVVDQARPAHP